VIEFRNVSFHLDKGRRLIQDLNLTVLEGETLVLLGQSGSGKTTTLKLINRLLDPTSGEVLVEGCATTAWDPIRLRRGIGYVIQEIGLFPHFTVERNVGLVPALEGWEPKRLRAQHERVGRRLFPVGPVRVRSDRGVRRREPCEEGEVVLREGRRGHGRGRRRGASREDHRGEHGEEAGTHAGRASGPPLVPVARAPRTP